MSNLVVQTNVLALNSHRNLKVVGGKQATASARLSSGYRINSAADDASGLAISEKMRAQIRGLDMASKNTQDGMSLVQTAEGGMQEIDNMVQRIRELAVQASNDTNDFSTNDRKKIQDEINQLTQGIDQMADQVEFNAKKLLNGDLIDSTTKSELLDDIETTLTDLVGGYGKAIIDMEGELGDLYESNSANLTAFSADLSATDVRSYGIYSSAVATDAASASVDITYSWICDSDGNSTTGLSSMETAVADLSKSTSLLANDGKSASSITSVALAKESVDGMKEADFSTAKGMQDYVTELDDYLVTLKKAKSLIESDKVNIKDTATIDAEIKKATDARDAARELYAGNVLVDTKNSSYKALEELKGEGLWFQTGANSEQGIKVGIGSINTNILGIGDGSGNSKVDVNQAPGEVISAFIDVVDDALQYVTAQRAKLGAVANRMEYTKSSLDISSENLSASESRIRDTDMAKEMMKMTAANVLQQAGVSMLSQANQAPQSVLQLLG